MFEYSFNEYGGVHINSATIAKSDEAFSADLQALAILSKEQKKKIIWLTLDIAQSHLIPLATQQGFIFHNCTDTEITLISRLVDNAYAPFAPTHSIGAGGVVLNENREILVVKEVKNAKIGYKLPGGHIELGERVQEGVMREVEEETGVRTRFESVVGFASKHPYKYDKTNIYFVCRLIALSSDILIKDSEEIEDARWVNVEEYIQDPLNLDLNRKLVKMATIDGGLKPVEFRRSGEPGVVREAFFNGNVL